RMIGIENALHILLDLLLDLGALVAHRVIQGHMADHGPHRTFRDLPDRLVGLRELEEVELRRPDIPPNRISDIDEVLVAGQHQVFAARRTQVDDLDILNVDLLHPVDGRGKRQSDARAERIAVAPEARDDSALPRRDRMHRGEDKPDDDKGDNRPDDDRTAGLAGESAAESRAAATKEIFDRWARHVRIDGRTATPLGWFAPRPS